MGKQLYRLGHKFQRDQVVLLFDLDVCHRLPRTPKSGNLPLFFAARDKRVRAVLQHFMHSFARQIKPRKQA